MAEVYVEPRPKSRDPHAPISHYVVETAGDSELHRTHTQQDAINWAQRQGHSPVMVARVRHLSDKRNPDHWRQV